MSENLTKDSIIDGATVEQWFQLVKTNKARLDQSNVPNAIEPDVPSTDLLVVEFGETESWPDGAGFSIPIIFHNVEKGNEFLAFRWDTVFPEGLLFDGIEIVPSIFEGAMRSQNTPGHQYAGRVGGYTSSLRACKDSGVLLKLRFIGPDIADDDITLSNFKVTSIDYYSTVEIYPDDRIELL